MPLLPQTIRPGVIGVVLFTGTAAVICFSRATEAGLVPTELREDDAASVTKLVEGRGC